MANDFSSYATTTTTGMMRWGSYWSGSHRRALQLNARLGRRLVWRDRDPEGDWWSELDAFNSAVADPERTVPFFRYRRRE
jgi:hypothetical protein